MPSLTIHTNIHLEGLNTDAFLKKATALVARELQKPEAYVMVRLEAHSKLLFAGTDDPAAFLELISLGLPADAPGRLSPVLSALLNSELGINPKRVYIHFPEVPRTHFAHDGKPFA